MRVRVDWSRAAEHMRAEHHVEPRWADEAVHDELAVRFDPDPRSESGISVRVIGYSSTFGDLLSVILLPADRVNERPDGDYWGANAWPSNTTERRTYRERNES